MENTKNGKDLCKALLMGTALVSLSSYGAEAATGTGTMRAIILEPIVVTNQQDLHFGSMTVAAGTAGTVTIPTTGGAGRTAGGAGGVSLVVGGALESNGILRISAASGVTMDVTLQAGPFTVDDTGAGAPMTVNAFQFKVPAVAPTITTSVTVGGFVDVPVGAVLNVAAGQLAGAYVGTYKVDVNYQ